MAVGLGSQLYSSMVMDESSIFLNSFLGSRSVASLLEATAGGLDSWKMAEENMNVDLIIDFT